MFNAVQSAARMIRLPDLYRLPPFAVHVRPMRIRIAQMIPEQQNTCREKSYRLAAIVALPRRPFARGSPGWARSERKTGSWRYRRSGCRLCENLILGGRCATSRRREAGVIRRFVQNCTLSRLVTLTQLGQRPESRQQTENADASLACCPRIPSRLVSRRPPH
jgi:hypothetical protein